MEPLFSQAVTVIIGILMTWIIGVIAARIPTLVRLLIEWTIARIDEARAHFTVAQLAVFDALVRQSIQAVEQKTKIGELLITTGIEKKTQALKYLQRECDRLNIPFDVIAADKAIEAAISQGWQAAPPVIAVVEPKPAPKTKIADEQQ